MPLFLSFNFSTQNGVRILITKRKKERRKRRKIHSNYFEGWNGKNEAKERSKRTNGSPKTRQIRNWSDKCYIHFTLFWCFIILDLFMNLLSIFRLMFFLIISFFSSHFFFVCVMHYSIFFHFFVLFRFNKFASRWWNRWKTMQR